MSEVPVVIVYAPPGVEVQIVRQPPQDARASGTGPDASTSGDGSPRPSGGAGHGDGSATAKQRGLVAYKARCAGVEEADVCACVGISTLASLGWKDVDPILKWLAAGSRAAASGR